MGVVIEKNMFLVIGAYGVVVDGGGLRNMAVVVGISGNRSTRVVGVCLLLC